MTNMTNEAETSTGKLTSSFTVSMDSCHGKKPDLLVQKVLKPLMKASNGPTSHRDL